MKIDNFYKFIGATFGLSYFIGLIVRLIFFLTGKVYYLESNFVKLFYLSNSINFSELFVSTFNQSVSMALVPFSYIINAVVYGFNHSYLLTSPFLGQIKLLVQLVPQIFFFISFIIFSTIGLKLIIFIIEKIVNFIFSIKNKKIMIKANIFSKKDILLFYIAIISIAFGALLQIYFAKIFFIFLINFQLVTYIFIILLYLFLIIVSLLATYKAIISLFKAIKNINKIIIIK
jgi:hypothetical protein